MLFKDAQIVVDSEVRLKCSAKSDTTGERSDNEGYLMLIRSGSKSREENV